MRPMGPADRVLLRVERLRAGYGRVQVLWDVDLHVDRGEIVCLVGANGAGKTTLLRAITGVIPPRGAVAFEGSRIDARGTAAIARLGIAHVPEGRQLFPGMTVREHLELGAAFVPGAWDHRGETLERVYTLFPRLRERERQAAGTMSGGEQQMLAVARSLMARPKMLLVDEPSLGLAPVLVQAVFAALREINRQGVTILLVEQNVRQTLLMAQRGYVLENGRIVLEGPGPALLANDHVDAAFAARTRFGERIAPGMLPAGLISAVLGMQLPGPGGIYLSQTLRFLKPVRIGEAITAAAEVTAYDPQRRRLTLHTTCTNQRGEMVLDGEAVLLVEPPGG